MSFKIMVFGANQVGKKTFIRALQLANCFSDQQATESPESCTVELNDTQQARMINLNFRIA